MAKMDINGYKWIKSDKNTYKKRDTKLVKTSKTSKTSTRSYKKRIWK